jgi:DNA primase
MDGKARLAKIAKPLLATIPESVFRDLMYQRLAELVGISDQRLQGEQASPETAVKKQSITRSRSNREVKQNATRDAIALLLQHPELAKEANVPDFFASASIQGFPLLYALYQTVQHNPEISSSALLERWRDKQDFEILQKLIQRNVFGTEEKANQLTVFSDAIQRLTMKYKDERFEILDARLKQGKLNDTELEEYKSLLTR